MPAADPRTTKLDWWTPQYQSVLDILAERALQTQTGEELADAP